MCDRKNAHNSGVVYRPFFCRILLREFLLRDIESWDVPRLHHYCVYSSGNDKNDIDANL